MTVLRLESYDRNFNFEQPSVILPPANIPQWPDSGFKNLTSSHKVCLSKLTVSIIDGYFAYRKACDGMSTGNLKAVEKGQLLLDSQNVEACSIAACASACFVTGVVRAAMKKKVSYSVRVKVSEATGEVLNTDCECPAGQGPHGTCKHVAAILLLLLRLSQTGQVETKKTCTENLQTFHKPNKYHDGTPILMSNINIKRVAPDDPRPHKYHAAAGYNDMVQNRVISYCATTSKDVAFRYLMPTADMKSAVVDHDYLKLPFTEYWVDQALTVNAVEAERIEKATQRQHRCREWYEQRQWRITASQFGAVCKATCKRNNIKLCSSIVEPLDLNNAAVVHGRQYESHALARFSEVTGKQVQAAGLFVLPDYPYLGATPDGVIDSSAIIEVKCPYKGKDDFIVPGPKFKFLEFDEDNSMRLKRTSDYYYQIQGQLALSKRQYCYFVVFSMKGLFIEHIAFEEDFWQQSMLPKLMLFHSKHLRNYIASNMYG